MVIAVGGQRIGIAVDAFRDVMEVIVKPLEGVLAGLPGYTGTAVMGDGRVVLVLDLKELVGCR
jgi:two-component system chemotaxis sensor kinase CheA